MSAADPFAAGALNRAIAGLSRWSARLAGLVILASAGLVSLDVLIRNLPDGIRPNLHLHSFDLTNFGFAAAVAFGFAYALISRAHIRIDVVYALFPLWLRAVLDAAALIGLTVTAAVMAWHAWDVVAESYRLGAMPNSTLRLPMAIPQAIWASGITWFALVAAVLSTQALLLLASGRLAALHAMAGPFEQEGRVEP